MTTSRQIARILTDLARMDDAWPEIDHRERDELTALLAELDRIDRQTTITPKEIENHEPDDESETTTRTPAE